MNIFKVCSKCKKKLPATREYFYLNLKGRTKYGLHSWCKKCARKYLKEYNQRTDIKQHCRKMNQKYYQIPANKERISRSVRKYKLTARGIYIILARSAKSRNLSICPKEEFVNWYNGQKKECYYCGIPEDLIKLFQDKWEKGGSKDRLEIDRKNNKGGYVIKNLSLACRQCNKVKGNILTAQEMKQIGQKYIKPKWLKLKEYYYEQKILSFYKERTGS